MPTKENILFIRKYKNMFASFRQPLCYYNRYMYYPIPKSGCTSIVAHFESTLIKNKEASLIELGNINFFSKEYNQKLYNGCKNLEKFTLFFHIREPWDRFLSALATEIQRSKEYKETNDDNIKKKLILKKCEEIKDKFKFLDVNASPFVGKNKSLINVIFPSLIHGMSKPILLHIPFMQEKIKKIEIWNFKSIKESIKKNWNSTFLTKKNITPSELKNIIFIFFNKEKTFYKEWREKTDVDHKLYDMVKDTSFKEISCKNFVKSFYQKI